MVINSMIYEYEHFGSSSSLASCFLYSSIMIGDAFMFFGEDGTVVSSWTPSYRRWCRCKRDNWSEMREMGVIENCHSNLIKKRRIVSK